MIEALLDRLQRISLDMLTDVVRQDQGIINPGGLWALDGHARAAHGTVAWSLVIKVLRRPLAQVDDGDERMRPLVRACRPVEDIDQLNWLHRQICLLTSLAHRCLDRTLVGLDPAAGQAPAVIVGPYTSKISPASLKIAASAPTFGVT